MRTSDIPDLPVLRFLAKQTEWVTHWDEYRGRMPSVADAMPKGTPEKLRLSKMRALLKRELVEGCACGCRGDWQLSEKGRKLLDAATPVAKGEKP